MVFSKMKKLSKIGQKTLESAGNKLPKMKKSENS
jgi:hypothetical protein